MDIIVCGTTACVGCACVGSDGVTGGSDGRVAVVCREGGPGGGPTRERCREFDNLTGARNGKKQQIKRQEMNE